MCTGCARCGVSSTVRASWRRVARSRGCGATPIRWTGYGCRHEESGYEEWGASGSIRIDPGASGRGLSLTLTPTWGVPASGVEQLFGLEHTRGLVEDRKFEAEGRLDAELGYGIGVRGTRGVVTPYTDLSLTQGAGRTVRAGTRWTVAPGAVLGIESSHQGGANGTEGTKSIQFRTEISW